MKLLKSGTMRSVKQELITSVCCCACVNLPCIWFSLFMHLHFLWVYIHSSMYITIYLCLYFSARRFNIWNLVLNLLLLCFFCQSWTYILMITRVSNMSHFLSPWGEVPSFGLVFMRWRLTQLAASTTQNAFKERVFGTFLTFHNSISMY